ncbi:WD40 repeat-like protein [Sporormia fimetaria CBS 119925]|uniref:ASTRA-associated protein 1 n=1 Tax=Sporormia fimetaria CBS 119925 TaxID=1340428 RepID=A0A6A6VD10_9PLEO|nr:WD40 repeat-like protein [Sporormia fimetaria CBS 119925]
MTTTSSATTLPPAQPSYIFRGHAAAIHSVQLVRQNRRLLTGDADGWVVLWSLESKRPVAVWQAHDSAILGTDEWPSDKIITHGRDFTLRIWQLRVADEDSLSHVLPADGVGTHTPKPWLLHTLPVNTLNFCAFSMCPAIPASTSTSNGRKPSTGLHDSILVAVPSRDDKKIDVYRFPEERLEYVVPQIPQTDTGMAMALKLMHHRPLNKTILIAGYEGGFTAVHLLPHGNPHEGQATSRQVPGLAQIIYFGQPHTQPILSLDALPDADRYFTSSADALIAAHRIPELPLNIDVVRTEHPSAKRSTSGLHVSAEVPTRDDPEHISTGVSQSQAPVPETLPSAVPADGSKTDRSSTERAVGALDEGEAPATADSSGPSESSTLEFSKRTVTPFPQPTVNQNKPVSGLPQATSTKASGIASLLADSPSQPTANPPQPSISAVTKQAPHKTNDTKHAGQQSLRVRSDGRLLVTGGWDSRIRIYSTKTLKEVAVLKWHKEGVYATAFGEILDTTESSQEVGSARGEVISSEKTVVSKAPGSMTGLSRLQRQRETRMQTKHWVVAGAKDGKVSLWEVF